MALRSSRDPGRVRGLDARVLTLRGVPCRPGDGRQRQWQRPQRAYRAGSRHGGAQRRGARRDAGAMRCCTMRCGPQYVVRCGAAGPRAQVATDGRHAQVRAECGEGLLDLVDVFREIADAVLDCQVLGIKSRRLELGREGFVGEPLLPRFPLALQLQPLAGVLSKLLEKNPFLNRPQDGGVAVAVGQLENLLALLERLPTVGAKALYDHVEPLRGRLLLGRVDRRAHPLQHRDALEPVTVELPRHCLLERLREVGEDALPLLGEQHLSTHWCIGALEHRCIEALVHWRIGAFVHHSLAYLLALVCVLPQLAAQQIGQMVEGAKAVEVVDLVAPQRGVGVGAGYDVDELGGHIGPQRGHAEHEHGQRDGLAKQVAHRVGAFVAGVRARLRISAASYDDADGPADRGEPHLKRADAREGARAVGQVITDDANAHAARSGRVATPAAVAVVALPRVELGVRLGEGGHYPEHAPREVRHVEHHEQQVGDGDGGERHRDSRRPALHHARAAHQP
eukprot:scaffold31888_cov52-Phaeocystis_antarctica.AAC.2